MSFKADVCKIAVRGWPHELLSLCLIRDVLDSAQKCASSFSKPFRKQSGHLAPTTGQQTGAKSQYLSCKSKRDYDETMMNGVAMKMRFSRTCTGCSSCEAPERRKSASSLAGILDWALEFSRLFSTCTALPLFSREKNCKRPSRENLEWQAKALRRFLPEKLGRKRATANFYNRPDEKSGEKASRKKKENSRFSDNLFIITFFHPSIH